MSNLNFRPFFEQIKQEHNSMNDKPKFTEVGFDEQYAERKRRDDAQLLAAATFVLIVAAVVIISATVALCWILHKI